MWCRVPQGAPVLLLALLLSGLLSVPGLAAGRGEGWHALGQGFLARRKLPAGLGRTAARPPGSGPEAASRKPDRSRLVPLSGPRTSGPVLLEDSSTAPAPRPFQDGKARRAGNGLPPGVSVSDPQPGERLPGPGRPLPPGRQALWLHTRGQDLFALDLGELAAALDLEPARLERRLRSGGLRLRSADGLAPWHHDSGLGLLVFAARSYRSPAGRENALLLETSTPRAGQRMSRISGRPQDPDALARPFRDRLHFEEEPDFMYAPWSVADEPDADYWFWDYLHGGFRDRLEVPLRVPDPAPWGQARLRVEMRGWTDLYPGDEHRVRAEINGVAVGGTLAWDGFARAVLEADFDQSLLRPDGGNTLALVSEHLPGTHPGQWLDQVDLDYLRLPLAHDNRLLVLDPGPGDVVVEGLETARAVVVRDPFGDAALLDDVAVQAGAGGLYSVVFAAEPGHDYLVRGLEDLPRPRLSPHAPASLADGRNQVQYLIIAPRCLEESALALADLEAGRFDQVRVVWLDQIHAEFAFGRADPEALARFGQAFMQWDEPPSYVVLLGKGSLDGLDRMGLGGNLLPVRMTSTPWALAPSDQVLLGFPGGAPFALGRIPVTNNAEGLAYVDKLARYLSAQAGQGPAAGRALLAADDSGPDGDFARNSQAAASLLDEMGLDVELLRHPGDPLADRLARRETWEVDYLAFRGHGSPAQLGDFRENFLNSTWAAGLDNTRLPVFAAWSCAVGDFSQPGTRSLAEALVLAPAGGAVAALAPSGLSLDDQALDLELAWLDAVFGHGQGLGAALYQLRDLPGLPLFMRQIYGLTGAPDLAMGPWR